MSEPDASLDFDENLADRRVRRDGRDTGVHILGAEAVHNGLAEGLECGGSAFQSKEGWRRTRSAMVAASVSSMPRSIAIAVAARYMPVSRKSSSRRRASSRATVDLPVPAGPSMVTMSGRPWLVGSASLLTL